MDTKYKGRDYSMFWEGVAVGRQYEKIQRSALELEGVGSDLCKVKLADERAVREEPVELSNVLSFEQRKHWNTRLDPHELWAVLAEHVRAIHAQSRGIDKLDSELAAFDSLLRAGKLTQYMERYVAIHQQRVFATDTQEFRLAARVALTARREGPIAICHVTTQLRHKGDASPEANLGHFESPLPEGCPNEV